MISLCGCLPKLWGAAPTETSQLGQERLRSEFQASLKSAELRETFKRNFGFADVAEWYWFDLRNSKKSVGTPLNLQSSTFEIRRLLSTQPYRLDRIGHQLSLWVSQAINRPFEAFGLLMKLADLLVASILIVLLMIFGLHSSLWSPAIRRDLNRLFGTTGPSAFYLSMGFLTVFAAFFEAFSILVFFAALISLLYLADQRFFLRLCIVFCLALNLLPAFSALREAFATLEVVESFSKQRTRLDENPRAIQKLSPAEKALLALQNGADSEAKAILDQIKERDFIAELLMVHLQYNRTQPEQTRRELLRVWQLFPHHEILAFNLFQVETQLQNLVAADEWRSRISASSLKDYFQRLIHSDQLLLPASAATASRFLSEFKRELGNSYQLRLDLLLKLFSPWVLLMLFYFFSFKSSGLCTATGQTTQQRLERRSRLATLYQEKAEAMEPQARHRYQQEVREFERRKLSLLKISSWIHPSAAWTLQEKWLSSLVLALLPMSLLVASLPLHFQNSLLSVMGLRELELPLAYGLSLPLFIGAIGLMILIRMIGLKRWES
jgi:hypothetical protein